MARIAFLGLGVMGFPMAGHLVRTGHEVTVYNRTPAKAGMWMEKYAGKSALTPREAVDEAEYVMVCVGNDDDLRSVCLGDEGAFSDMAPGSVLVDHTTVSAQVCRELAGVAARAGIGYVDAPVSGGQAGAESGQLSVMCGGSEQDFGRVEPVIDAYARICRLMGPIGSGQMTKMCNQIAIAGLVQSLSEALRFAEASGLKVEDVVEVISQGAAGSWQMVNRHKTMAAGQFDHGFSVDWMRKDLGICLQAAGDLGVSLPVTALVDQFYQEIQSMGGSRWDTSSLIERLRR